MYTSEWKTEEQHGRLWKEEIVVCSEMPTGTKGRHKILVRIVGIQAKTKPITTQIQRSVTHWLCLSPITVQSHKNYFSHTIC